ncbi:Cytochrome c oxidase subunit 6A1, mitochondrial [Anthophora retusa]
MAKLHKLGQFGHTFTRNVETIVQTVEQRSYKGGDGAEKMWRNLSLFVGFPAIALAMLNSYLRHQEEKEHYHRPEFVAYPYMKIMNKPFPWGDGKHSLFHNPKKNYVPGIGYEE